MGRTYGIESSSLPEIARKVPEHLVIWPTPLSSLRSGRGGTPKRVEAGPDVSFTLHDFVLWYEREVLGRTEAAGPLDPTWVEWLMGFPEGWTDLEQ
jgi:hypothetical protein